MATPHIESKEEEIAKTVLMPGDPMRAKYIADNFLTDVVCVNKVRGMLAYTGLYKDKKVTVFASGMGCPSIGIYAYELFKFYDVDRIIRIGTCGSNCPDIKLLDVILADSSYSLSSFPKLFDGDLENEFMASTDLNDKIYSLSKKMGISLIRGEIITSDVFDVYVDFSKYIKNYPESRKFLGCEMESFVLFYLAKKLNKEASCLLTVVDSHFDKRSISSSDRENSLNDMIKLALEAIL